MHFKFNLLLEIKGATLFNLLPDYKIVEPLFLYLSMVHPQVLF